MHRSLTTVFMMASIAILIMISVPLAEPNWVSLDGTSTPGKPTATLISSNDTETIIRFNIAGFWSNEIIENGISFQTVEFPGYFGTMDIGKAQLPVIRQMINIPASSDVRVSILAYNEVTLSDYNVYPFQTPLLEGETPTMLDFDRDFYQQGAFYPEARAQVSEPAIWRDLRVVRLDVSPVRYKPSNKQLAVCTDITVRLDYSGSSTNNVKVNTGRPIDDNYDAMYRRAVLNYGAAAANVKTNSIPSLASDEGYDYLIITADAYVDNLTPLVEWKTSLGLVCQVIPISQIGATVDNIKDYITQEYLTNNIRYVLLVGNEVDIPGYDGYKFFSDYYYSLVEGKDNYPDLAIGRFSVENSEQVDNMVRKTVRYEANPPEGEWLNKALLVAHKELAPLKYQQCKEEIRTAAETTTGTYSFIQPEFSTLYGAAYEYGGDEATNSDVVAAINSGLRVVNYRGHGNADIWWSWNLLNQHFSAVDVDAIDNGEMTPVIFGICCLNNDLFFDGTCLGESFTRGDDAAVAYLSASDPSYTTPNHTYDKVIFSTIYDDGLINSIGDVSNLAAIEMINFFDRFGLQNARMYLWLGDPSLNVIYNFKPKPPAPTVIVPDNNMYFDAPAEVTIEWGAVDGAEYYHLIVDDNADFGSPIVDKSDLSVTQWTTPSLSEDVYFFKVASGTYLCESWSETRQFAVGVVVEKPALHAPEDTEPIANPYSVLLLWNQIEDAPGYTVQVAMDPAFGSPIMDAYSNQCSDGLCAAYILEPFERGTYYWRVKVADEGWPWSDTWSFAIHGSVENINQQADKAVPDQFQLFHNYPNPFNPSTTIYYGLSKPSNVKIEIYNMLGQRIITLVDAPQAAGAHQVEWDGRDNSGNGVASGMYLYRLTADNFSESKKMILLK